MGIELNTPGPGRDPAGQKSRCSAVDIDDDSLSDPVGKTVADSDDVQPAAIFDLRNNGAHLGRPDVQTDYTVPRHLPVGIAAPEIIR